MSTLARLPRRVEVGEQLLLRGAFVRGGLRLRRVLRAGLRTELGQARLGGFDPWRQFGRHGPPLRPAVWSISTRNATRAASDWPPRIRLASI